MENEIKEYTYEEAVARKKELMDKINSYSEAMLLGKELPFTEEEVDAFQEEYEELEDKLKLTKEEKLQKLSPEEVVVKEDGSIEKKVHKIDKVHFTIFFMPLIFVVITLLPIFEKSIVISKVCDFYEKYFAVAYERSVGYGLFSQSKYIWGNGTYFNVFWYSAWLPLLGLALCVIMFIIFKLIKNLDPINKKIMLIVLIVVAALVVFSITFNFIYAINNAASTYVNNPDSCYNLYYYEQFMQSQMGY